MVVGLVSSVVVGLVGGQSTGIAMVVGLVGAVVVRLRLVGGGICMFLAHVGDVLHQLVVVVHSSLVENIVNNLLISGFKLLK